MNKKTAGILRLHANDHQHRLFYIYNHRRLLRYQRFTKDFKSLLYLYLCLRVSSIKSKDNDTSNDLIQILLSAPSDVTG